MTCLPSWQRDDATTTNRGPALPHLPKARDKHDAGKPASGAEPGTEHSTGVNSTKTSTQIGGPDTPDATQGEAN